MPGLDSGYEPWARANVKRDMPIGADAARELLAKLDAARRDADDLRPAATRAWEMAAELDTMRAELDRLRAIEDRAQRTIVHMPDPDWIKCARFILDGHAGRTTKND